MNACLPGHPPSPSDPPCPGGALSAAIAAFADALGLRLHTAFADGAVVDLVTQGVVVPAGVPAAALADFYTSDEHRTALRNFFILPGGHYCVFTVISIASGNADEPAPAGNLAWATQVAVLGCLAV